MDYALIEDGQIAEGPKALPRCWRNVSGLNLADAAHLKSLGWLPVVGDKPLYDAETQYLSPPSYEIGPDAIARTYSVIDYTAAEIYQRALAAWYVAMDTSDRDHMPRWLEDHIEGEHAGVVSVPALQQRYAAKKALRATKPVES